MSRFPPPNRGISRISYVHEAASLKRLAALFIVSSLAFRLAGLSGARLSARWLLIKKAVWLKN